MSLPVFIYNLDTAFDTPSLDIAQVGASISLNGAEGRHAVSVKRIAVGEHIELVDGHGTRAELEVVALNGKDTLHGHIVAVRHEPRPQLKVTVVQALPKSDRSELAIDLLTQAGVDHVIPWQADRCVAKWTGAKRDKGIAKWQAMAASATKQSRRAWLPTIDQLHDTAQIAARLGEYDHAIVLHETATSALTSIDLSLATSVVIIIGPEGGITEAETENFRQAGANLVKLGPEVLRTATAGMVALAAIGATTNRWAAEPC
ncbi:RNA methyltransferase, RsmE family [Corynebacterium mustelae]|uniref:Ribosomal RNA small subunit methyltransferase E n=1 Tax=Corynebacterium mustelae TaxID=571915 RepID=A0A0G3H6A6_9CORY|nr:16S rRNA (uracil(1498)-N(3))-methyltransferase [Corynebacterium mustelae]AKK06632.1 RNA methyltransferase, RsmE family [Corynebacterium mustelae]